jgi:hypothetical protein
MEYKREGARQYEGMIVPRQMSSSSAGGESVVAANTSSALLTSETGMASAVMGAGNPDLSLIDPALFVAYQPPLTHEQSSILAQPPTFEQPAHFADTPTLDQPHSYAGLPGVDKPLTSEHFPGLHQASAFAQSSFPAQPTLTTATLVRIRYMQSSKGSQTLTVSQEHISGQVEEMNDSNRQNSAQDASEGQARYNEAMNQQVRTNQGSNENLPQLNSNGHQEQPRHLENDQFNPFLASDVNGNFVRRKLAEYRIEQIALMEERKAAEESRQLNELAKKNEATKNGK